MKQVFVQLGMLFEVDDLGYESLLKLRNKDGNAIIEDDTYWNYLISKGKGSVRGCSYISNEMFEAIEHEEARKKAKAVAEKIDDLVKTLAEGEG